MEVKLKKEQSTLSILGKAVIAFGLWTLIKYIIYLVLTYNNADSEIREIASTEVPLLFILAMIVIVMSFEIIFRFIIGMKAIRESKGKKTSVVYLIFASFLLFSQINSVVVDIEKLTYSSETIIDTISTVVFGITSTLTTLWLIISAIKTKYYSKKINEDMSITIAENI